jgi:hypothetical protein
MAVNSHFFKGQFVSGCNGYYNPIWRISGVIMGADIENVGWFLVDKNVTWVGRLLVIISFPFFHVDFREK